MTKLFWCCLMLPCLGFAQLEYRDPGTPEEMVSEFLLGNGILVSNVQFTGTVDQRAAFSGGEFMGLDSGIILSTAVARNIIDFTNFEILPWDACYWDADLNAVAASVPPLIGQDFEVGVTQKAILEFDFVPFGDSLSFDYAFGSNEYPQYINTEYNDVFAFFVSGPGINGPFSNGAVNIANVPGSNPPLPITVSSVNENLNSEYFVNNWPDPENIFIHGYTTLLTAHISGLQIGETYHIRIGIADGADVYMDSVVLLRAGSFTSVVEVTPGGPGDFNGDGVLDINDFLIILSEFGCLSDCISDLNNDGISNVADVLVFLSFFEE